MSTVVIASDRFVDHVTPPGHPERVERAHVMEVVASEWTAKGGKVVAPRPAAREDLLRVHTAPYLDSVARTEGRAVSLDADTYTSPQSHEVALLAAGAAMAAVDLALGDAGRALALVRPPGHHAEAARAMGFCLYNNVAVAAAHALARGVQRVAVVDYDVHHGNGTQAIFYDDPRVLYLSVHQFPFYPGTGAVDEVGRGAGEGFTLNVPLDAGAGDADYELVFAAIVEPVLRRFSPELVIVSAGFDAHERDPLGGMRLSTDGFARLNQRLLSVAADCCGGRLAAVTEGGYDLKALGACLMSTLAIMSAFERAPHAPPSDRLADARWGRAAVEAIRAAHRRYWPGL